MRSFFQKTFFRSREAAPVPTTDIHAHLLPGIDDGPADMEASLVLIERLHQLGYKNLIATPHVYWEYYPNTRAIILDKLQLLQSEIQKANIPISIDAAAEYFLDEHFEGLVRKKELLTLGNTSFVLVECSTLVESMKIAGYLFLLQAQGYQPILAHPERYLYYKDEDYQRFLRRGCKFQLNILSLAGHYGKPVQKRAIALLKKNYVHFLGTDAHRVEHLEIIDHFLKTSLARRLLSRTSMLNNTILP